MNLMRKGKLEKEGFSCGNRRKKSQEDDLLHILMNHPMVGNGLIGLFYVLMVVLTFLHSKEIIYANSTYFFLGVSCFALFVYRKLILAEVMENNVHLLLFFGVLSVHLSSFWLVETLAEWSGWDVLLLTLLLPHSFAPMILTAILGRRVGFFSCLYLALLGVQIFQKLPHLTYLGGAILLGFSAVWLTHGTRRRNRYFIISTYLGVIAVVTASLVYSFDGQWVMQSGLRVLGLPLLVHLVLGLLVGGLMPLIESMYGLTTDIAWVEMGDMNHPLLKRLSMEAPGTYHHSLMVATLAEGAAEAIGANASMTRACALYHDIGKMNKPEYFIENMVVNHNPHKDLTARMSALILMSHVKDGVDLALKYKLNGKIIDVIEQHHGTSLVWFFYQRAKNQQLNVQKLVEQAKAKEDDVPQVSEENFRYPGPIPQFKEAAIISLADAVESASRTLDKPSSNRIESMIEEIVLNRIQDQQLDECGLTLDELARIKSSFLKTLLSMLHSRIKYTKEETEK
jgi:hypothetical protein